ncbi:MAG: DDE-type integrase/transposase/recombinase [Pyrinomonadaceae bacterium]
MELSHVDETYIKVGEQCKYLYRAVDKHRPLSSCSVPSVMFVRQNASFRR